MTFLKRFSDNNVTTLTDAATIDIDMSLGAHFQVTLGGNRTLGNPTNASELKEVWIAVRQDATGGRTLAFSSDWIAADSTVVVNPAVNSITTVYAISRDFGAGIKWYYSVESAAETGGISGTGTTNTVATWSSTSAIQNSTASAGTVLLAGTAAATGGIVTVRGGDSTSTGVGGQLNLTGGAGAGATQNGGIVAVTGGAPGTTGVPGSVTVAGAAFGTGGTVGGNVVFRGGRGSAVANDGVIRVDRTDTDNRASRLQFVADNNTTVSVKAPTAVTTYELTLPTAQGAASTFLQNNGSGTLSWVAGGGTSTVQDEGSTTSTTVTTFNFTGAGVTASGSGATATINVPGGVTGSFDATVTTTNTTATLIYSYTPTGNSKAISFQFQVWGSHTTLMAQYVVSALFEIDSGGTITEKDTYFVNGPFEEDAAWDVTMVINAGAIEIKVTGASSNVNWRAEGKILEHSLGTGA